MFWGSLPAHVGCELNVVLPLAAEIQLRKIFALSNNIYLSLDKSGPLIANHLPLVIQTVVYHSKESTIFTTVISLLLYVWVFSLRLENYQRQPQIWITGSTTTNMSHFFYQPIIHFVVIKIILSE